MKKTYYPYVVKWKDHSYTTGTWVTIAELIKEAKPCVVSSIGYLVSEDDDRLVLTSDITDDGSVATCIVVLKSTIISRNKLGKEISVMVED